MAMRPAETEDTQTALATQRTRARDDAQKELDTEVGTLVKEWESAGSPANGVPNRRYEVDDVAEAKRRVNRAFTLNSKDRTPKLAPMWFKDGTKDSEGYVAIKFSVRVSIPSANQSEPSETEKASTTPPESQETNDEPPFSGQADQESGQEARSFRRGRR